MIRDGIVKVQSEYYKCKAEKSGVDSDSSVYQIVTKDIPSRLTQYLNSPKYLVTGSVGVGRWAEIPWIGIFNRSITTTAQKGYYICILFGNDMKSVYLTIIHSISKGDFSQNWDEKSVQSIVLERRDNLIKNLDSKEKYINSGIVFDNPTTFGNTKRAILYSKSVIAYKEYENLNFLTDEDILNDIKLFLELYENMQGKVDNNEAINSSLIDMDNIEEFFHNRGFNYNRNYLKNFYLSLKSKPFVILSGISGTGKTKIVELFARAVGATADKDNGRYKLIPVRPDWSDSSDLLGYTDIQGKYVEGPLTEMIKRAQGQPELPHFVVLDEMNLARVEYYLSDFLSIIESRSIQKDGKIKTNPIGSIKEGIPDNLYIIGTVNMDETTHPFSKKVLDRANTIEFNEVYLMNFSFLKEQPKVEPLVVSNDMFKSKYVQLQDAKEHMDVIREVSKQLEDINKILTTNYAQVGYRVRDEIAFYMSYNEEYQLLTREEAMDFCLMQKILPRLAGAGDAFEEVLKALFEHTVGTANKIAIDAEGELQADVKYPRSAAKLKEMYRRLRTQGYASFWIA